MQLSINGVTLFVQAMSLIFGIKNIYVQWYEMQQDEQGNWIVPVNAQIRVEILADGADAYDAFLHLDNDQQNTQLGTFLATFYPTQQNLN